MKAIFLTLFTATIITLGGGNNKSLTIDSPDGGGNNLTASLEGGGNN